VQTYVEAELSDREGRAHWRALFDAVKRRRLMAPSLARTLLKLAILYALFCAALWLSWSGGSWAALAAAYGALALLLAQFAFAGHDAGHGSVSARGALNRALGQAAMTLVTGLAFDEWIGRHRAHHQFCQDEARDPDLAVALVVSLTERSRRAKGPLGRWLTRRQWLHIWPLSLFFGHSQRLLSQAAVARDPRRWRADALVLGLHYLLWFGLPLALGVPFVAALLAYLVPLTLLGPYLAAIFWVNHIGMPLVDKPESFSFFEHQAATSRTIVNPPGWDWLFGGLNFQVEHHLFPQVPSDRLGEVHEIVRAHFAREGLAYNAATWPEAVAAVARHLRRVARAA
jgi:fatty acid desaturase